MHEGGGIGGTEENVRHHLTIWTKIKSVGLKHEYLEFSVHFFPIRFLLDQFFPPKVSDF